jgi:hypothetical protein
VVRRRTTRKEKKGKKLDTFRASLGDNDTLHLVSVYNF